MVGIQKLTCPSLFVLHMKLLSPSLVQLQGLTAGTGGDGEASLLGVVCQILSTYTINKPKNKVEDKIVDKLTEQV